MYWNSDFQWLCFSVPPSIRPFEFGTVIAGMRTRVTCLVALGDLPLSLLWLKDGQLLTSPELHDITVTQPDDFTSSLVLPTVEPRHAGNYTCKASNPAREASFTAQLNVHGTRIIILQGPAFVCLEHQELPRHLRILCWIFSTKCCLNLLALHRFESILEQ